MNASNATLLGTTDRNERVVYKPVAGERPLWDFQPETLAIREVLTFEVDRCMGFGLVPETALGDGIYGPGSVQRYVDIDETFDPHELVRRDDDALWPIAVLDLLTNNADRKLGHILRSAAGALVAIDHGLTFHPEDKLRTVLWGFAGAPAPSGVRLGAERLRSGLRNGLGDRVQHLLGTAAHTRLVERTEAFLTDPVHPQPPVDRPALPWPPY